MKMRKHPGSGKKKDDKEVLQLFQSFAQALLLKK